MKGFIEVTSTYDGNKYTININYIVEYADKEIGLLGRDYSVCVKETREEITQLIKEVQK